MVILELSHSTAAHIRTNIPLNTGEPVPNVGDWMVWNRLDSQDHRYRGKVSHKTIDYARPKHTVVKLLMESVNEDVCRFQIGDDVECGTVLGTFAGTQGTAGMIEDEEGELHEFPLSDIQPVEKK